MSLLQLVAKWQGQAEGERAARSVLRLLSAVSLAARGGSCFPVVGPRAQQKRRSVALVRSKLLASIDAPPTDTAYPQARSAVAAVTRRRTRSSPVY